MPHGVDSLRDVRAIEDEHGEDKPGGAVDITLTILPAGDGFRATSSLVPRSFAVIPRRWRR